MSEDKKFRIEQPEDANSLETERKDLSKSATDDTFKHARTVNDVTIDIVKPFNARSFRDKN